MTTSEHESTYQRALRTMPTFLIKLRLKQMDAELMQIQHTMQDFEQINTRMLAIENELKYRA